MAMAEAFLQAHPGLKPYVLSDVQPTGTTIGHGAYGSVEEVAIPVCGAAKKVHELLLRSPKITSKFAEELQLMATLRHENIVQFLGIYFLPGSHLPALVMERLLTSLHDLLDPETDDDGQPPPQALPFFTMNLKCSVLYNVASGLAYLHERSPPVIHRDLSARNILLNSGMVAKIADLGVARIVPRIRAAATMTKAPGASVYMPPEAVAPSASNREKAKYDASIDIFSLGVVTIFTIGETFPCDPLPHNYTDEKSGLLVARTELQRRSRYMANVNAKLHGDHPLIRLIQQCLQNLPAKRPDIREVLCLLEEARAGIRDEESERNKHELVRALQNQLRNHNLERVLQDLVTENADLQSRVQEVQQSSERETVRQQLTAELRRKEAELTRAEETIRRKQQQIQEMRQQETEKDELVQAMGREIGDLKEQLQSSEALVADFQKDLQQKDTELNALRTRQQGIEIAGTTPPSQPVKLTVLCRNKEPAPWKMTRGSATTDHQFAYFTADGYNTVNSYQWSTEQWEKLPSCPYSNSALVFIDGSLTAVGGWDRARHSTGKLFTLQLGQWVEEYPPMNAARSSPAVVSTSDGDYIIASGGCGDGGHWTTTVELFHVSSRRWYELTDLPRPLTLPSATICGHRLHVIGDGDGYSLSHRALPSSDQPITSQTIRHLVLWTCLPCLPLTLSTAATLCGQLVIIGGKRDWSSANSILQLVDGQWVKIGSMSRGRFRCLAASPSPDKMMIVGGYNLIGLLFSVEECAVAA